MAINNTPNFEVPTEMRDFAEKSVEQARKAIDGFMGAAQKTVDTFEGSATTVQSSAKDMTRKTFAYAEQNISAAFEHAQRLVRAKDVQEAMQLQSEFVRSQFAALQDQMREFGALAQSAAQNAAQTTANQAREFTSMAQDATRSASNQGGRKQPKR